MNMNSDQSPLLKLPAELRNKIFGYVMGSYDIYIEASRNTPYRGHGHLTRYVDYQILTTILPPGLDYRPAAPGDDLPNFALSRVCRQLYGETSPLPYTLNNFKFVNSSYRYSITKESGKYSGRLNYTSLDFWLERRLPVQIKVLTSIAPMARYINKYYSGKRPAFLIRFPGLQKLDLRAVLISPGDEPNKDKGSDISIVHPTQAFVPFARQDGKGFGWEGEAMRDNSTHFDVTVRVDTSVK
jgi:hypothetical protein